MRCDTSTAGPFDRLEIALEKLTLAEMQGDSSPDAIPMILHCPSCGERHIDQGDFATQQHHTHACQHCGFVWRPAVVHTFGVQFLPGFKDGEDIR